MNEQLKHVPLKNTALKSFFMHQKINKIVERIELNESLM